jgi:hypothetical protein
MGGIMLIKTLMLFSLTYIVGITGSVAVHQVVSSPGTATRFQPDSAMTATISGQIANRSVKRDRLPFRQATPQVDDKPRGQAPGQIAPNPKFKAYCKPPIDVLGRCFADAPASNRAA